MLDGLLLGCTAVHFLKMLVFSDMKRRMLLNQKKTKLTRLAKIIPLIGLFDLRGGERERERFHKKKRKLKGREGLPF